MNTHRLVLAFCLLAGTAGCERPPIATVQLGYRGTGMVEFYNPRLLEKQAAVNAMPPAQPPASQDGPRASQVFKNVKVLGDQSVGEFTRTMAAMTAWVAPQQGCTYCHNPQDFASDSVYTKVVARRMLEMTRHVNADWQSHVASTGVTCYTCHRGNNIPTATWFQAVDPHPYGMVGNKAGRILRPSASATVRCPTIRSRCSWPTRRRFAWPAPPRCRRATASRSSRRKPPMA